MIAIAYKIRHFLSGRKVRCAMASMGGVGSTALARHVGSLADKTPREHAFTPMLYAKDKPMKLGYIYGNPYNAVLSVFRRSYQDMHTKAMNHSSDTAPGKIKDMTIEQYLERGIDEFRIERQFDNWINAAECPHSILLIKYEDMGRNIDEILRYFESDEAFEFKTRKSSWEQEPDAIKAGLEKMYGSVKAKIDLQPGLRIIPPFGGKTT
jgi:hypothetical protein